MSLKFAGYAALFDIADAAKDTIRKGAFRKTLLERAEPIPLYWQHRPEQKIGEIEYAAEDEKGLRIIARIDKLESQAASKLLRKTANGLSFGYRAKGYHHEQDGRILDEIDLFEISLVTYPLQSGARVHMIR